MKKVGIYDPYLNTLGGGERYCLTLAEILLSKNFNVDLFWSGNKDIVSAASSRFDLNLKNLNIKPDVFQNNQSSNFFHKLLLFYKKVIITSQYDYFFYLSDWSIPFLFAKKNFLHIQVPFIRDISLAATILNKIKLANFDSIICNSYFTKKFSQKSFGKKNIVIYPPVDIEKFAASSIKKNYIISVGRFDNILNSKKQDFLIESFRQLLKHSPVKKWRLILAGGSLQNENNNKFIIKLKKNSINLPVDIIVNPSFIKLQKLYSQSKIYWHSAGFQVNENISPENTEHFGITPVEAMAAGCVPILVKNGGLTEIIEEEKSGLFWESQEQLVSKTLKLISHPSILDNLAKNSIKRSRTFSKQVFEKEIVNLFSI